MKKTQFTKLLSCTLCIVLIAAMALFTIGCNDNTTNDPVSSGATESSQNAEVTKVGKGSTEFDFTVIDLSGAETRFKVATDKTKVGEALLEVKLISGDEGQYGLYVKTVNGITLDYDKDGKYWAFYVNDAYATSGVDTTEIKVEDVYCFKAE